MRGLAESLRSQAHESANRLHTVVSLIELGRTEEALAFATAELEVAQQLTDRVVGSVDDPVVAALLLGKSAQAAERGVELRSSRRPTLHRAAGSPAGPGDDRGQPVDNAFDAVGESDRPSRCGDRARRGALLIRVADNGPGSRRTRATVFARGWSTKPDGSAGPRAGPGGAGRRRYGGSRRRDRDLGGAESRESACRPAGEP